MTFFFISWLFIVLYLVGLTSEQLPTQAPIPTTSEVTRYNGQASSFSSQKRKPLDKSKLKYIEIGGLFPMNGTTGWLGGQGCLPAAMMALEDVNNDKELLPGYYLNITWNNSQVGSKFKDETCDLINQFSMSLV